MRVVMTESPESSEIERRLVELRAAHRALDARIHALAHNSLVDQLELQRLKKQKLAMKDQIARLESDLLPDIIA
ncbi:MAG: YdcH family protein [Geminicoccaceae bacterium]